MPASPQVVVLAYPLPARVQCPRCWRSEDPEIKSRGDFCDPLHLAKHLKAKHPGDTITYKCSLCNFRGYGAYPVKPVKAHYDKEHANPRGRAGRSTDGASSSNNNNNNSGGSTGARDRPAAGSAPGSSASVGVSSRGRPSDSRQPRLRFTAPTRRTAATTPPATATSATPPARTSPSYAAVTAAGPSTCRSSPSAAATTAATSPAAAAMTGGTAAILDSAATGAPAAATTDLKAHPHHKGRLPSKRGAANQKSSPPASREARGSPRTPPGEATGPSRRTSGTPPTTTSTAGSTFTRRRRRSSSVPLEKCGASRPMRGPPLPSPDSADDTPTFGGRGGDRRRRSPERTPPNTTRAGPRTRSQSRAASASAAKCATEARTQARPSANSASRGPRRTSERKRSSPGAQPASTTRKAGTAVRDLSAALTLRVTEVGGGAQGAARTPPLQRGTMPPTGHTPTPPPNTRGGSVGVQRSPPSAMPAVSSAPATLTTSTVTTVTCGAPVMSTGFPAGRRGTPPRLANLSTIQEVSPCLVEQRMRPEERTPTPPGEEERRHPEEAAQRSEGDSGEEDEPWRVRLGRRARRRLSGGSSGGESPAAAGRGPVSGPPPLQAPANINNNLIRPCTVKLRRTLIRAITGVGAGIPLRGTGVEGASGERAGRPGGPGDVSHPSVPVSVPGVMGRRRRGHVAGGVGASGGAPASPRSSGGGEHPRGPRRVAGPSAQPSGGRSVPAAVARLRRRQRVAARDVLVGRAEAVTSIADLEEFAASVAAFFGEEASGRVDGGAPGVRDRPVRSREAGVRRGEGGVSARGGGSVRGGRGSAPAGPPQSGEGRGGWVREATRLQALYRTNRRKAVREVLQGPAEFCQVPKDRVHAYFERLYRGGEDLGGSGAEVEGTDPSVGGGEYAYLMDRFTEREVDRRLRRMTNSAPGPDGITYRDLRGADPGARLLTALFNACYRLEAVPASWKTSNTVLVYKNGDRDSLENWRPLALGDTAPKLFAALIADRMTEWAVTNNKLCPAQKGFLRDEGCFEHNFVLQEILTDARRTRRQAVVAWLDLSNAFGSVPHAAIRRALVRSGVPGGLVNVWNSMYDGCSTRVRTAEGYTAPVPIRSGVRQGCPLSPIVFDLAIDSVLRAVTAVDAGFDLLGSRHSIVAYADDIALVADSPEGMRRLLAVAEDAASSAGLRFNPAKCATLHLAAGSGGRVLPTTFVVQGQPVHHLSSGEPYRHLGVPTGSSVDQTPFATIGGLLEDLRAVDQSLLAPWQKLEIVATNILPRLDFLLRGAAVEKKPLKTADLQVRRMAKSWLNLPQRASAEVVYLPLKCGGYGLLSLADLAARADPNRTDIFTAARWGVITDYAGAG